MKRTANELMDFVNGKKLDREYLLDVTSALHNVIVEDFFRGWDDEDVCKNDFYDFISENMDAECLPRDCYLKMKFGEALLWSSYAETGKLFEAPEYSLKVLFYGVYLFFKRLN